MGEVSEKSGTKVARSSGVNGVKSKKVDIVEISIEVDSDDVENCRFRKMENLINVNGDVRVGGGVEETLGSGEVETVESERSRRAEAGEDESMTLSQMQMMVKKKNKEKKKKNLVDGKLTTKAKELNTEKFKVNEREEVIEKEHEKKNVGEKESVEEIENVREEERDKEREEKEEANLRKKSNRRRVPKVRNLETVNATSKSHTLSEIEKDRSSEQGNSEVLLVEKENEKETGITRGKRERRRVSKYGNSDILNMKSSKNHVDSDIEMIIASKKGEVEMLPVEDSDFHDFDKDRRERSFKKGQVWAVYDDADGMPRHYALVNEIVCVNPFEVTLSWLQLRSNGDEELVKWLEKGFHVSCGIFQVTRKVTIRYLKLFSHIVDCERAARELYRIYPKKGSIWAVYNNSSREGEERNQRIEDKWCYNVVVSLSSYSDIHGLSIAYLEKVSGFRTVYKRREIGANAVVCLGASDIKLFSHQIPAKKLSGEESSGLPKDCWELDPASLTPQLLTVS